MLLISYRLGGGGRGGGGQYLLLVSIFQEAHGTDKETNSSKSLRQLREGVQSKARPMISSLSYVSEEVLRMVLYLSLLYTIKGQTLQNFKKSKTLLM
jgi:hypothetical protein